MGPNVGNNQNKESTIKKVGAFIKSIPGKVGAFVEKGEQVLGRSLALPFNAVIYAVSPSSWRKSWSERWGDCKNGLGHVISNQGKDSLVDRVGISAVKSIIYPAKPSNWGKSGGKSWHDIKNGGRYVMGKPPKEFNLPVETTQSSKDLGVRIKGYKAGQVFFLASRTLTGDVAHLGPEQLDKIKNDFPNVAIDREGNKITIEIDVEKIINDIKDKNPGKGEEEIRKLAIEGIEREVDRNLKGIAKITGGEFKKHTDLKLLYGIAEKLYKGYDNKKEDPAKSSEVVTRPEKPGSSETLRSMNGQRSSETLMPKIDGSKPSEAFRRIVQEAAEPLVNSGEAIRSAEGENNESRNRRVNRPIGIGF